MIKSKNILIYDELYYVDEISEYELYEYNFLIHYCKVENFNNDSKIDIFLKGQILEGFWNTDIGGTINSEFIFNIDKGKIKKIFVKKDETFNLEEGLVKFSYVLKTNKKNNFADTIIEKEYMLGYDEIDRSKLEKIMENLPKEKIIEKKYKWNGSEYILTE